MAAPKSNAQKQKDAVDWFIGKARTAAGFRKKIIMDNPNRARGNVTLGKMYFYWYDPKLKETLPVYDRFPMVFPIEMYGDGFLGLNLHYLSNAEREVFLGRLMKYTNNDKLNARTKLEMTYSLLNSTKKLAKLGRPCIKRYLYSHVRSSFIEIRANEWENAIALPVELFVRKG